MVTSTAPATVTEPVQIFKLAHRYLLYDVNVVTYLRRQHNISGVLIGSLPQASQQNVFLGFPLELMPEEARLLVENKAGYIVDDVAAHKRNFLGIGLNAEERRAYQAALRKQGQGAAKEASKKSDERKKAALKKLGANSGNWNDIPEEMLKTTTSRTRKEAEPKEEVMTGSSETEGDESLFASPSNPLPLNTVRSRASSIGSTTPSEAYAVTPTTSYPPLQALKLADEQVSTLPGVPKSYLLYRYLHGEGYFLAPGLRFGCQYMAYPGDPLRFHSHFLCNGMKWNAEFDLLDLVGGGRLGTGVKKGFLVGGEDVAVEAKEEGESAGHVRAFCIEWGGM